MEGGGLAVYERSVARRSTGENSTTMAKALVDSAATRGHHFLAHRREGRAESLGPRLQARFATH